MTFYNGLPSSILRHWRRRQTRRQAFSFGVIDSSSVRIEEHLTDGDVIVVEVFREPLLGELLLGHGLLIELDVSLCEEVILGLITCEGEVIVIRPHLLGESAQGTYYLTSGKLKSRRKCWKIKMKKRRKMKLMKRSRKSERTLNSCMRHGDDANILSQCAMCKGWVWQQQNRDWLRRLQHYAHSHVFIECFKSLHTLLGFVLCFVLILCFVSSMVFVSLWSSTHSVSRILAYVTSRKRVFWGVVFQSLWSAVIKSPNCFALGTDCTSTSSARSSRYFRLQADVAIWVFQKVSADTMLARTGFHCSLWPHCISWEELEVSGSLGAGFPRGSEGLLSSTKFSLNTWSQSGRSCNRSLCTSSRPSF